MAISAALMSLGTSQSRATLADYQTAVTNTPSILSYYTFDQETAADARGTNPGTLKGTTAFVGGPNGAGKALLLGGLGWVNLGVVEDFAFADSTGSAEAWVQAGSIGGVNVTVFANQDGYSRWAVHMNGDKSGIGMWNGGAYYPTIAIPNPSTNWHHLVSVFDSGSFLVYWDGSLVGSTPRILGYTDFTKSTQIGSASPYSAGEGWVGRLDEVAFYADALTPETILAHYQAFFAGNPPEISKQPRGGTYLPGVALTLSVKASGQDLAYQWYKGTAALSGQTAAALAFASFSTGDAGTFSVVITNLSGSVTSAPATIAVAASLPAALTRYQTVVSNEASLISYYTFDRLLPEDQFGPNDGTLAGSADWAGGIGGGPGQGLWLDGGGYVKLGSVPSFDFSSGTGTAEAWIRADWTSASGYPCYLANRNEFGTTWSLHLSASKSTLTFFNGSDSDLWSVPGGTASTNWHHVAVAFDGGKVSYYWDGTLLSTHTRSLGASSVTVQFGSSGESAASEAWNGMLDEIAFYSTALSAEAIAAHYNAYYVGDPPAITTQPVGGSYLVGQPLTLSVGASGAQLSYKWYKDNILIPGATTATIGTTSLTVSNSGVYYATVSNPSGSTNSASVVVQVGNNITRYQATVLAESGLLSYYTFDGGDAQDARNAHPGTIANTVSFGTGPGGVTNQSLILDGTGHIDIGQVADFDFASGSGTVEAWVWANWSTVPGYDPTLFADRDGGSVWSVHMSRWKNEIGNWNNQRFQTMAISSVTGWHHYAIVFDASHVQMYWDGKALGDFVQAINFFSAKTTQIGSAAPTTTDSGWMGGLDEVAFYTNSLGAATIWSHYLAMVGAETAPQIAVSVSGKQVTLSWASDAVGYSLESAESLPATSWTAVSGVVNNRITLDAASGMRFFRLRK